MGSKPVDPCQVCGTCPRTSSPKEISSSRSRRTVPCTSSTAATPLIHPAVSPRAGLAVAGVGAMSISGNRMILNENFPPTVYLFDAGPDGRFNTPDDVGRKLAEVVAGLGDIAIAGEFAAFFDTGS